MKFLNVSVLTGTGSEAPTGPGEIGKYDYRRLGSLYTPGPQTPNAVPTAAMRRTRLETSPTTTSLMADRASPRNPQNNASILRHEYLCTKCIAFTKTYNKELFQFQQENGMYMGGSQGRPLMSKMPTAGVINEEFLSKNPLVILKNGKTLQRLAIMQVIALTLMTSIDFIVNERPQCNDRLLQKSMVANLHQWLVRAKERHMSQFDDADKLSMRSRLSPRSPAIVTSPSGSHFGDAMRVSETSGLADIQKSFQSLLTRDSASKHILKSPSEAQSGKKGFRFDQPTEPLAMMNSNSGTYTAESMRNGRVKISTIIANARAEVSPRGSIKRRDE